MTPMTPFLQCPPRADRRVATSLFASRPAVAAPVTVNQPVANRIGVRSTRPRRVRATKAYLPAAWRRSVSPIAINMGDTARLRAYAFIARTRRLPCPIPAGSKWPPWWPIGNACNATAGHGHGRRAVWRARPPLPRRLAQPSRQAFRSDARLGRPLAAVATRALCDCLPITAPRPGRAAPRPHPAGCASSATGRSC